MIEKILSLFSKRYREERLREKLKSAIERDDLALVRNALQDCALAGIDLNKGFAAYKDLDKWGYHKSALFWAIGRDNLEDIQSFNNEIIQEIFNLGKIDLTRTDESGKTALYHIIYRIIPYDTQKEKDAVQEVRADLIEKILQKLEGVQVDQKTIMDSLERAASKLDLLSFKKLWDFFKKDLVNINGVFSRGKHRTLLDVGLSARDNALQDIRLDQKLRVIKNVPPLEVQKIKDMEQYIQATSDEMEQLIRAAGGKTLKEIPEAERRKIVRDHPSTTPTRILAELTQNVENTHWYTKTAAASLHNLKLKYSLNEQGIISNLKNIRAYLSQSFREKRIDRSTLNRVIARLETIETCTTPIAYADNISLRETLAIVWQGILDKDAIPALGNQQDPNDYVNARKEDFVKDLFELKDSVCPPGMFNAMIGTLNAKHTSVALIPENTEAEAAFAKSAAQGNVVPFVTKLLMKKPLQEQKEILSHWDDREEKDVVALFRKEAKEAYKTFLDKEASYAALLDPYDKRIILGEGNGEDGKPLDRLEDMLNRPAVHKGLDNLIAEIKAIPVDEKSPPIISMLKKQAANVYLSDKSFKEEYESLQLLYGRFQQLESLTPYFDKKQKEENGFKIGQFKIGEFCAGFFAPNTNRAKKMEVVRKSINDLKEGHAYDHSLDKKERVTAQTGEFSIALKCK